MKKPRMYERIERMLDKRRRDFLFRQTAVPENRISIDCSTNSYLALECNAAVRREAARLCEGEYAGNCASRLIASRSSLYEMLENEVAQWNNAESALVFNSGYAANLGIIQSFANRDTVVFSDRLNHASIIDGIRLSGARLVRYAHCDYDDLARRLAAASSAEKIIITDSVFSMDGDRAPLVEICELARNHGAAVMVDEAHGTGMFGPGASGLVEHLGLQDAIDIHMGTLSKAVGGLGGFFAGDRLIRDFLVNNARSLIYSTGLPHAVLAFDLAAIRAIRAHPGTGAEVLRKAERFRSQLRAFGFDTLNATTQIVPCIVPNDQEALALSRFLRSRAIKAPAIRPPTVPRGTARVRFSIHAGLAQEDIDAMLDSVKDWRQRNHAALSKTSSGNCACLLNKK